MRLIWTFDSGVFVDDLANTKKNILINYYIFSIGRAKTLGYTTTMYCDENSLLYFDGLCDNIIIAKNKYNSPLYDYMKIQVLEDQIDDDYCLIDGDLILNFRLPNFKSEITFDAYEVHFNNTENWSKDYEETVNKLTELGISEYIPEWTVSRGYVINCGILSIKPQKNRNLYIKSWINYNNFIKKNIDKLNMRNLTNIGAQYLLTILRDYHNLSSEQMSEGFGKKGYYYTHDAGNTKYITPMVPIGDLIKKNPNKNIF